LKKSPRQQRWPTLQQSDAITHFIVLFHDANFVYIETLMFSAEKDKGAGEKKHTALHNIDDYTCESCTLRALRKNQFVKHLCIN